MFPDNINTFVDLFGGSGTVLFNVKAKNYIYNDINNYVADILHGIQDTDLHNIYDKIEYLIDKYNLIEKEGFLKLREDYNNGKNAWCVLYTLSCYSFNWQIRFNNSHQYNSSYGKDRSSFTNRQRKSLLDVKDFFQNNSVNIYSRNFSDIALKKLMSCDLVYCDPPYLGSVGVYNDGNRGFKNWDEQQELKLLELLDKLSSRNVKFALSNNLKYENKIIDDWSKKYNTHLLDKNYNNCSYHKKERGNDIEVLITNY